MRKKKSCQKILGLKTTLTKTPLLADVLFQCINVSNILL